MDPVQELAGGDHGQKEPLVSPVRQPAFQVEAPPLMPDEDARVDQDSHGSRTGSRLSSALTAARSFSKLSASSSERWGREASSSGSSRRGLPAGTGTGSAPASPPRIKTKLSPP